MDKELLINLLSKGLEATSFSFNVKQRKAIVERDKEVGIKIETNKEGCQWPYPHKCSGKIHVHHALPEMYQKKMGIPNPDTPDIAISLCNNIHIGDEGKKQHGPHPDQPFFLAEYRKGDKKAFEKMQKERAEKLDERVIYWDDTHERELLVLARRNTQKMDKKKKGWWSWS